MVLYCAQNKTRTCTPLRAPAPQAGVSTNFTIWAEKFERRPCQNGCKSKKFHFPSKINFNDFEKIIFLFAFYRLFAQ